MILLIGEHQIEIKLMAVFSLGQLKWPELVDYSYFDLILQWEKKPHWEPGHICTNIA
jgi:hypothetical protein